MQKIVKNNAPGGCGCGRSQHLTQPVKRNAREVVPKKHKIKLM
jgi:hypothetical protein